MDLQLTGRRAMVTGGTRGIGRSIVEHFVAEGASVAFCARDANAVKRTQDELAAGGARVFGTALDVADAAALADWVTTSAEMSKRTMSSRSHARASSRNFASRFDNGSSISTTGGL